MTVQQKNMLSEAHKWFNNIAIGIIAYFVVNIVNDVNDIKNHIVESNLRQSGILKDVEATKGQIHKLDAKVEKLQDVVYKLK